MIGFRMRMLVAVIVVAVACLGCEEAMAEDARAKPSSASSPKAAMPAKAKDAEGESPGSSVNIRVDSSDSSGSPSAPTAVPAAVAAARSKDSGEKQNERKARQRAADEQLIAKVQRDRELEAAAAKKRDEDRKRATMARFQQASCVFKPVMTDADIAACRGQ